ncbi:MULTISPECIES: hypothetical protein [Pseudomonas]|uniref:hypothetical protein n=1 Tax=Pseudomonas TaxID=286 RepID=UPI0023620338|nr:hypothetical protein [Pseudomonas asplenii]
MQVDDTHFPLVWMQANRTGLAADDNPFAGFEALLERQQPFVLLNEEGLGEGRYEHTHEERKQVSLWMKRHKEPLRAFVKVAIYVEADAATRAATESFAPAYEKFWGYPMLIVASRDEALARARDYLAN